MIVFRDWSMISNLGGRIYVDGIGKSRFLGYPNQTVDITSRGYSFWLYGITSEVKMDVSAISRFSSQEDVIVPFQLGSFQHFTRSHNTEAIRMVLSWVNKNRRWGMR